MDRSGAIRLIAPICGGLVMACAPTQRLSAPTSWTAFQSSAEEARCDPYFSEPFRGASRVDAVVLGEVTDVVYETRSDVEASGVYHFEVERVLFGNVDRRELTFRFRASYFNGHTYGFDAPSGRSLLYLDRVGAGEFELVLTFHC
jgi:hypothetical protein